MMAPSILWNTYEPALTDDRWRGSAGGGQWTLNLWDQTLKGMYDVHNVSVGESGDNVDELHAGLNSDPACIVLVWRWPMPDYPQRHKAWVRQCALLDYALNKRVPVLVHDQDLMSPDTRDPKTQLQPLKDAGIPVRITMPAFYPPSGYETLHFPYPFRTQRHTPWSSQRLYKRSYVGNNYQRYAQTREWFEEVEGDLWGNWLEEGPGRESPEQVLIDFGVGPRFHDRCDQRQVQTILERSVATVHLAKPIYCKHGFMTIRYAEAALSGTLAFVPYEMRIPPFWRLAFPADDQIWRMDLDADTGHVQKYQLGELVNQQQLVVQEAMSHFGWANAIDVLIRENK